MNDPTRPYRHQFRNWNNERRLQHEFARYEKSFIARRLAISDEMTIRQRMRERFPDLKPKKKGDLNILAIYHHYNWENESLKPALEKFGRLLHYDWFDKFDHSKKDWLPSGRKRMNENLIAETVRLTGANAYDVIFTYISGELVSPETMQSLRKMGIPMVNLALNDKEHFVGKIKLRQSMGSRDICRWFDLCWTSTEDAVIKYVVEGALPVYLPEGANPDVHKPYDEDKTIDVSFIGQCYGNRPDTIARLADHGIMAEAYGYGWPNGSLSTEEMVRLYSKSKINLGFGGVIGHKNTYCLKGRDFEIPMSGGLYVTEHHPELERFYDIGREIVTYRGFEDLISQVCYLLENPEIAENIRKNGWVRAHREHSWEMRFEKIFKLIGLI